MVPRAASGILTDGWSARLRGRQVTSLIVRVHVVSDVHGNADALARAGGGADALLVPGDLIDFVDYRDHSAGFVGGGLLPEGFVPQPEPVFRSYLRTPDHFAAAVAALG